MWQCQAIPGWNLSLVPHYRKLLSAVLEVGLGEEGCHSAVLHKSKHLTLERYLWLSNESLSLLLPSVVLQMTGCGTL